MRYLILALKGFLMGTADVVPGVSGGTMALILGVYEELLLAVRSFDLVFLKRLVTLRWRRAFAGVKWRFVAGLFTGILLAVFTLAKLLDYLLIHHPVAIWSFFFGLILASIHSVSRRIERWSPPLLGVAAAAALGAYLLVGLTPTQTPNAIWFLVFSGALAICAMILPGISGAFILVLLGKYHYVLEAVNQRDLLTLAAVGLGAVAGLVLFARFLTWLFQRRHDMTVALLCGLMAGSLRKIWPFKTVDAIPGVDGSLVELESNYFPSALTGEVVMALLLAAAAAGLVLVLERLAGSRD